MVQQLQLQLCSSPHTNRNRRAPRSACRDLLQRSSLVTWGRRLRPHSSDCSRGQLAACCSHSASGFSPEKPSHGKQDLSKAPLKMELETLLDPTRKITDLFQIRPYYYGTIKTRVSPFAYTVGEREEHFLTACYKRLFLRTRSEPL